MPIDKKYQTIKTLFYESDDSSNTISTNCDELEENSENMEKKQSNDNPETAQENKPLQEQRVNDGDNTEETSEHEDEENQATTDEKQRLLMQRKFARGNVTRLYNKMKALIVDLDEETIEPGCIEAIMTNLTNKFEELKVIENNIQKVTELPNLDKEIEGFSSYEEKYEDATSLAISLKHKMDESTREETTNNPKNHVRFPPVKITPFSGRPGTMEFLEFYELFSKATEKLSIEEKFVILKSLLIPPSSSILVGMRLTSENYEEVVKKLMKKYASPKLIINRYVRLLITYEPTQKPQRNGEFSGRQLRNIYDTLQSYIRQLLLVDEEILTSERIIYEVLCCVMPPQLQMNFELSPLPKETIADFFEVFNQLVEIKETTEINTLQSYKPRFTHTQGHGPQNRVSLVTRRQNTSRPHQHGAGTTKTICQFCQGNHISTECRNNKIPIQERFKYLKDRNICSYCGNKNHIKIQCEKYKKRLISCKICFKTSHSTALHGAIPVFSKNVRFGTQPTNTNYSHNGGSSVNRPPNGQSK